jgi:tetratricopeptide (TPR) repeat protein/energy-coupling factor transporter ATP-binding protein EcfA2
MKFSVGTIEGFLAGQILRVFVSSPSDVAAERVRVKLVTDRLNAELEGVVRLDVLRWEDAFYTAAQSFQQAIDGAIGNMSAADMVLCIVWKRAGLKLNPSIWRRTDGSPYESGTVLEFETAVEVSRKHKGVPDVYLFRKSAPVVYEADRVTEQLEQYQLLQAVWKRWTESTEGYNTAGYQSFADPDDFEIKLEACLRQWLERRGVVAQGPVWDRAVKGSPFRGLAAFEAAHSSVFFGREHAIARATAKLRAAPFLLVIGASGSGKSSLVRAGLLPRLTAPGVLADVDLWRTVLLSAGGDPIRALAHTLFEDSALGTELKAGDFSTPDLLAELLTTGGKAALAPIRAALARAANLRAQAMRYEAPRPAKLMIAVDQAERLFVEGEPERVEAFASLLRALVEAGLANLIVVLRSDTYGRFQAVEPFLALLDGHGATLDLLPPTQAELEEIVTRPVAACHPPLAYETSVSGRSLAEVLVTEVRGGDALALLQITLQRLYEAEVLRGDGVLQYADYPGMGAAVAQTAQDTMAKLSERSLKALPALITAMVRDVTLSPEGDIDALTIVPVSRAAFERGDPARTALLDEFIAHRLLTAEDMDGHVYVRPVHEALLRVVPAAVDILKENAALIWVRETLDPMVAEWTRAPDANKADFLATSPAQVAGAAQLDERFREDLPASMRAFIASSLDADFRRRAAERSRGRLILAATAAGLVVAVVLAGLAAWQWRLADEQKTIADTQRTRAEAALTAAAKTADTLIFDLAQDLRNRTGMPLDLVRLILERVQNLQRQLVQAGDRTPELISLEAAALDELASLYLDQGDPATALAVSERARDILLALIEALPKYLWIRRDAAIAWNKIGDAKLATSDARGALDAYKAALALMGPLAEGNPSETNFQRAYALSLNKVADALAFLGRREEALTNYRASITIVEKLTASDAGNVLWQSDLAFTQTRIGMLLASAGKRDEALAAYNKAAAIREALAEKEPQASNRKRDVFNSLANLGGLLVTMGRRVDALAAYRKALTIITTLSASDPGNLQWQRDTATITGQIGSVLAGDGVHADALDYFRRSLAISEKLLAANPDNVMWLRDVAVVQNQIGDVHSLLGQSEEALVAYRVSLTIAERLAADNPQASDWQRDLAISLVKVADAIVANHREEARGYYERSRLIRETLAASDPENLTAQRDVSLIYDRIGNTLLSESRHQEALDTFRKGLAIRERIVSLDPRNVIAKRDVGFSHDRIATTLQALGRVDDARAQFRTRLLVIEDYAATDASNAVWQIDLVLCLNSLGQIGDEPRARYERILAILRNLEREKKLTTEQTTWIAAAERFLATLPR